MTLRDDNSNSGDADLFPSSSHSVREFVAGTAGGFAGKLLDYPLDTVKVLLQTQQSAAGSNAKAVQYRGAWHCLTHTLRTNGIAGLYQGISSPLLGSMAENALLFWAYHHCQVAIVEWQNHNRATTSVKTLDDLTVWQRAVAGAGAGAVVPLVLTPVELIKCRLQVQNNTDANFVKYKGPLHVIGHTLRQEGLLGLYRGFGPTVAREIPGNFVWYGVYEGVCLLFTRDTNHPRDQVPAYAHLLGGAAAGVGYWTAFYPADTVKSRMQTTHQTGMSFWDTFWHIYRGGGVRALYRGWGVTCLRAAPAHAAIFGVYEQVLKVWN